jgi:hypothetical protein
MEPKEKVYNTFEIQNFQPEGNGINITFVPLQVFAPPQLC